MVLEYRVSRAARARDRPGFFGMVSEVGLCWARASGLQE